MGENTTGHPTRHPTQDTCDDLATRVAGQGVRERADAEYAAARSRSRVVAWLARAMDVHTDERSWRVGAEGEESVGRRLERLRAHGWHVLHSVPVGSRGSDIDHVLVGPGGVWTVNTKKHPGAKVRVSEKGVRVNGHPTPYLRNSRFEAERASRLLSAACERPVVVQAALVVTTGTLIPDVEVTSRPDGVVVLQPLNVVRRFRRLPAQLTPDEVTAIFEVARRPSTWTSPSR